MKINVLDQGYVEFIEQWGSDERIIESARMSTGKGFVDWDKDAKLLRYLYEHKHTTPFEMGGITVEVMAPIFVFREWHRHRTQSYNEFSARYAELPNMFYLPSGDRLVDSSRANRNRQASGSREINHEQAYEIQRALEDHYKGCRAIYESLLKLGVAKEIARLVIPVAQYSKMRASANLWNWLRFLKLRMDDNAQFEIRMYANAVYGILNAAFPRTMELYTEEFNGTGS